MRRSQKWRLALGLIVAGFCTITAGGTGDTALGEVTFTVYVHNYAQVDSKTLADAEQVATRIFRKVGVETRWVFVPEISTGSSVDLSDSESDSLSNLRVYILPEQMARRLGMPGDVMGLAPGKGPDRLLVYVFYKWLRKLADRQVREQSMGNLPWHASVAQVLGAMMAHELGHILLNLPSHSETGIMKGDWDPKDLCDIAYGLLLFTRQQAEVIRADIVRRSSQQQRAIEIANLTFTH